MNFLSAIESKRDGKTLSTDVIRALVADFTDGRIPDYQMSAFLMAVYFRGLQSGEKRALTLAMRDSGDALKLPKDPRPVVDKHSTGGVGDKVSLPLAPLLASLGMRVPMISGRGLGITGGTLDKLESIPGFQALLEPDRIVEVVQEVGCVIVGQTHCMVPADKKLYALRDVTGTVPSIPLITASILSKKLAEDLDALLLDTKFGNAAFMQTADEARQLATSIVELGRECGVDTRAILTDMNTPLGRAAGNWLEVKEAVDCLRGEGPEDLWELTVESAAHLLTQTGLETDLAKARERASAKLADGSALAKWNDMLAAQGADMDAMEAKLKRMDVEAVVCVEMRSERSGFVTRCDARLIGEAVRDLGGGRLTKESRIHHDVGVDRLAKPGETLNTGDLLARIWAKSIEEADLASRRVQAALDITDEAEEKSALVCEVVE